MVLQIPIAIPHLSIALVLINLLSGSGLVARIGHAMGLIATPGDFPQLLNDAYGLGIILTYIVKEAPFIAIVVLAALMRVESHYNDVARVLGASSWQCFRFVTLPLTAPALISSSMIVLAFIFNAFEIPFLLGRQYPAMLSVVAQRRFLDIDLAERPPAMAIAVVMFLVTILLAWAYSKLADAFIGTEGPTIL